MSKMCNIPEDMLKDLKCSSCEKYLSVPPITLYNNTKVCGRCTAQKGTKVIDHAFECFAKLFLFPCCYKDEGCNETFSMNDMKQHEDVCMYKEKSCPLREENCTWTGKYTELINHYEEDHEDLIVEHPYMWKPDTSKDNNIKGLLMKFDDLFFLINITFCKTERKLSYEIHFIGESELMVKLISCWELTGENGLFLKTGQSIFDNTGSDVVTTVATQDNVILKLKIQQKMYTCRPEKCRTCGNDLSTCFEEKDNSTCKKCMSILQTYWQKLESKSLPCPNSPCTFIAENEWSLHKHIMWLCLVRSNFNNRKCTYCDNTITYNLINHFLVEHPNMLIKLEAENGIVKHYLDRNDIYARDDGWNNTSYSLKGYNSIFLFNAFDYLFRVEVELTRGYLIASIVSNIPTKDVDKFKCTLNIVSGTRTNLVTHLEIDFSDISKEDMCRNPSRFDWLVNVFYPLAGFTLKVGDHFLQIIIKKINS